MTVKADTLSAWARSPRHRRIAYAIAALIAAVLIFFPRPYVARATLVPQDTASSTGTNSLLTVLSGQSQNFASLLGGGRVSNDLYLIIGRSDSVASDVIKQLKLVGPSRRYSSLEKAKVKIADRVDVHLLLGGVMEIQTRSYEQKYAYDLTQAYVSALSKQLAAFGRQLIENKRIIVERRFAEATQRVGVAETALNLFRRRNNLAEPDAELGQALTLRTQLEAQLQAKQIELQTQSQFRGPESAELAAIRSEVAGLRQQLARTATPSTGAAGPNVAGLGSLSNEYLRLYRDYRFAQALYEVYARSLEQVAVEQLASDSTSYVQVIDPAHLDPERQLNVWAIALLACIIVLALFTEWYAPLTGLFRSAQFETDKRDGLA